MRQITTLFKLPRLLYFGDLLKRFNLHHRAYDFSHILMTFSVWLLWAHWYGCFWWYLGISEDPNQSPQPWIYTFGFANVDLSTQYTASIYFSIMTLAAVGYGDITAKTTPERWYAIFGMLTAGTPQTLPAARIRSLCVH